MKIKLHCSSCPQINNPSPFKIELPISDDLYYTFTCDNGHFNKYSVGNTRYGLLFESGLYAFLDGYNREAVSSFYVALERFYEYIVSMCFVYDCNFSFSDLENLKKTVYLSERMYGVFCSVYMMKFKKAFVPFDNKDFLKEINVSFPGFENSPVKFRNKIIHEGYIPSEQEILNYAKAVSTFIIKITNDICDIDPKAFFNFHMLNIQQKREKGKDDYTISNIILPTYIGNIMVFEKRETDIETHLEYVKIDRAR